MLPPKYSVIGEFRTKVEAPFDEIYFMQSHLIEETETLVNRILDPNKSEVINIDALQAICFLVITDQYIDLGEVELHNCLNILGVHPVILEDTVRHLKKMYRIPRNADLLRFIRYIGPILLEKMASKEFE